MNVLSKEKAVYVTEDDDLKKITLKYNLAKTKYRRYTVQKAL